MASTALPAPAPEPGRLRKLIQLLEPWYDWGTINTFRMDGATDAECTEGEVYRFELQWLGIHLGFQIGRTPKREG